MAKADKDKETQAPTPLVIVDGRPAGDCIRMDVTLTDDDMMAIFTSEAETVMQQGIAECKTRITHGNKGIEDNQKKLSALVV